MSGHVTVVEFVLMGIGIFFLCLSFHLQGRVERLRDKNRSLKDEGPVARYSCPACDKVWVLRSFRYCPECGKALDWSKGLKEYRIDAPEAPEDSGPSGGTSGRGGGRQISEITGPTRDLLVDLLSPLANLNAIKVEEEKCKGCGC